MGDEKKKKSIPTQLINEWEKNILTFQIPNGENNKSFLLRLKNFVSDLKKKQKECFNRSPCWLN